MLRGYRLAIIALGLTLLLGKAEAQNAVDPSADGPSVEQSSAEDTQGDSKPAHEPAFPVRIVEDPEDAARAERREDDSDEREKEDLAAQNSMAKATEQIVTLSWYQFGLAAFGTFIAAVGTGAVIYSLHLARESNKMTVRAMETFDVPHVYPCKIVFRWDEDTDDNPHPGCYLGAVFRNYGRAPAIIRVAKIKAVLESSTKRSTKEYIKDEIIGLVGMIGPQENSDEIVIGPLKELAKYRREINEGQLLLRLMVRLSYGDVLDNQRMTGQWYIYDWKRRQFVFGVNPQHSE